MARWRVVLGSTLVVVSASATIPALPTMTARAAGTHRAMVIVDTGSTTYQRVVTFSSDSITGIQALDLAGANPVVYSYAGQGGAVCRLFGVGRDAGPNCLGGGDGDNRYWAYFRAERYLVVHLLPSRRGFRAGARRRRRGLEVLDRPGTRVVGHPGGSRHDDDHGGHRATHRRPGEPIESLARRPRESFGGSCRCVAICG